MTPTNISAPHPVATPSKSLFSTQQVSFTLRAPRSRGMFWLLTAIYMMAIIYTAPLPVYLLMIFSMPSSNDNGLTKGGRAMWLWLVGMIAAALVLTSAPGFKPEGLSLAAWWAASPIDMAFSVVAVFAAVGVGVWHITWIFPGHPDEKQGDGPLAPIQ